MFDIGFAEILLIAVVSLVLIGPKKLPETVRFLGFWLGKLRRSVQNAKQEMEREFGLDEIRRELYNEELLSRMDDERKQIERRLGSSLDTLSTETPIPASQKIPAPEDFIDDEIGDDKQEETLNPYHDEQNNCIQPPEHTSPNIEENLQDQMPQDKAVENPTSHKSA